MHYRHRFAQFKKRQPEKFNSITNRTLLDLSDLEKAVNEEETLKDKLAPNPEW